MSPVTWPRFTPSGPTTGPGVTGPTFSPTSLSAAGGSSRLFPPEVIAALLSGGLGVGSALLTSHANTQQAAFDRELEQRRLLAGLMSGHSDLYGNELSDISNREHNYLSSFAMNPVSQQQDIYRAAAQRVLAGAGPGHVGPGGFSGGADFSDVAGQYLSDPALAGAASRFYEAAGALSPSARPADLSSMGFGPTGAALQPGLNDAITAARNARAALRTKQHGALDQAYQTVAQPFTTAQPGQDTGKKKSSIWKKLLGGIVLGASAFIPGLPAVLAPGLFGAGLGVGTSAFTGANPAGAAAAGAAAPYLNQGMDYFNRRSNG